MTPILRGTKIARALKVLETVDGQLTPAERTLVHVDCYANGREQGFAVRTFHATNATASTHIFAENRNSDDIVVYRSANPAMQGTLPNEEEYRAARHFPDEFQAAVYILEGLRADFAK